MRTPFDLLFAPDAKEFAQKQLENTLQFPNSMALLELRLEAVFQILIDKGILSKEEYNDLNESLLELAATPQEAIESEKARQTNNNHRRQQS